MTIDHIKADIPAYLHGDLPESRQRQIESHAAGCENCRHALNKARSKLARSKRQALKNANPDPLPNLLLTRLGRQTGLNRPGGRGPRGWLLFLVLVAGGAYLLMRKEARHAAVPVLNSEPVVAVSTSTLSGAPSVPPFDVQKSSPTTVAAVVKAPEAKVASAPPAPPQTWDGPESAVKDFREVVINGRRTWHALWGDMGRDEPAPPINFLNTMLVGVFAGEQPAGSQVLLGQPKDLDQEVQIPYRITSVVISSGDVTTVAHPYALTTIPRAPKTVHLVRQQS